MNLISETGVPIKGVGSLLSSKEVNQINQTLNDEVEVGNAFLKSECFVNFEVGDYSKQFSLSDAIDVVPVDRRTPGMKVRFRNSRDTFSEFVYTGVSTLDEDWGNTNNWRSEIVVIDGGEW